MLSPSLTSARVKLSFAEWFKLSRSRAGVSQRAIADSLRVSVQTVGNWEGGRSQPSLDPDQMLRLCTALGVSLDVLAKAFRGEVETTD
jgi:DNA-binding transcriptional regulator YiaG